MNIAKNICALLCEDVREEKGCKLSYLGVFGIENCGIIPDKIPAFLPRVCLAIMMSDVNVDIKDCDISISLPGEKPINMKYPIPPNIKKGQNATFGITVQPFKLNSPGQGLFEIRFNKKKKPSFIFNFNIIEKDKQADTQ